MLSPMPIKIVPPTADISAMTFALRCGEMKFASSTSPPWNTRIKSTENVTPTPIAAPNIMLETKSSALLANRIL